MGVQEHVRLFNCSLLCRATCLGTTFCSIRYVATLFLGSLSCASLGRFDQGGRNWRPREAEEGKPGNKIAQTPEELSCKSVGVHIGKFELNSWRKHIWMLLELYIWPLKDTSLNRRDSVFHYFFEGTPASKIPWQLKKGAFRPKRDQNPWFTLLSKTLKSRNAS